MRAEEWNTCRDDPATSVVERVSTLLSAFEPGDTALGVNELSRRTNLPKATVSRLVRTMVRHGFFERDGAKVSLSLKLLEWGELAARRRPVRQVALPYLADLREATGQTVHLAILDGADVVYVEILQSRYPAPKLPSKVGGRLPAHATAVGKALLAVSPVTAVRQALAANLTRLSPRTLNSAGQLQRQLQQIATSGLAYDHEESGPGIVCVASVIRDPSGTPVAAVSASGWIGKMNIHRAGHAARATALTIGRSLAPDAAH